MFHSRTVLPIGCLLVTGALGSAQTPPAAPVPPVPMAAPAPAAPPPAPAAARAYAVAPIAPEDADWIREMARDAAEQAKAYRLDSLDAERIREVVREAKERAMDYAPNAAALYDMAQAAAAAAPKPMPAPAAQGTGSSYSYSTPSYGSAMKYSINSDLAFAQAVGIGGRRGMSEDRYYEAGQRALDNHRWDEALENFNQVAALKGNRADSGYYWKAYALNKLGRRDEALAAIAELRKSYASSRWMDDAKALEIEAKQAAGRPVSPEAESDEELKLMALNGIMQSDPERAIPLVENMLKGSASPRLKRQALFVLAQSSQPKAQQVIEQIARGGGNPDLQVKAIEALSQMRRRQTNNSQNQLFQEIYTSTSDLSVKRAILNAFRNTKDNERLFQLAKAEKSGDLRIAAIQPLGEVAGQPELWQLYQAETSPDMKIEILRVMHGNGNAEKLADVVKNEKDPKVRRAAFEALADQRTTNGDQLVALYTAEQDPQFKQVIVDRLSNPRYVKNMIELAKAEKDTKMKLRIVERLSNMHSKEASDYLLELLK
jgi:hypothetical protein